MANFLNGCIWKAQTGGLGLFVLGAPVRPYFAPLECVNPSVVDGAIYNYFALSGLDYEIGSGVYVTGQLSRDAISNSSAGGNKVNFGVAPTVYMGCALAADPYWVPGGSSGQIQYNKNGVFAGEAALFWNDAINALGINTASPAGCLDIGPAPGPTEGTNTVYGLMLREQVNGPVNYNFYSAGVNGKNVFEGSVKIGGRLTRGVIQLTDVAVVTLDASKGNIFSLLAAGDRVISSPINAIDGQEIRIIHTASGADRTLSLATGSAGAFRFGSTVTGLTATLAGKSDYITAVYNGQFAYWDVIYVSKGYF